MSASNDDSESVDQFLARIASLKDKRDREDEERTRKLEEEILQGRKERQARRAERARSLSPSKASPAASVSSMADSRILPGWNIDPPVDFSPHPTISTPAKSTNIEPRSPIDSTRHQTPSEISRPLPTPPATSHITFTPGNTSGLSRSGTLSWQQRPSSRDSNSSRPRPLSGVPAALVSTPPTDPLKSKSTDDLSRSQIAQSLGSKDPSWFKQTSDRGMGSAAYRKTQVESESEPVARGRSMRLPGLSREVTPEPARPFTPVGSIDSREPVPSTKIATESTSTSNYSPENPSPSGSRNAFALPLSKSQVLEPPTSRSELRDDSDPDVFRTAPSFGTNAGASLDRPASPTKGLGGFVQSAMMKRSDSVNKRWSVQANAGLKRGDSIASNPSIRAGGGAQNRSPTRESRILRGDTPSSPLGGSRPTSSHGPIAMISKPTSIEQPDLQTMSAKSPEMKSAVPSPRLTTNIPPSTEDSIGRSQKPIPDETLPVSPTKTMDSRRWSPTKASWLESALARPESPKLAAPKSEQPSWKADLQKSKLAKERQEGGVSPTPNFAVPSATGLLRSPPPGGYAKPLSIGGMPEGFSSGKVTKTTHPPPKPAPLLRETPEKPATRTPKPEAITETAVVPSFQKRRPDLQSSSPTSTEKFGQVGFSDTKTSKSPPAVKPKPQTPPKTDFRASLKSRQIGSSDSNNAEPEFKAVFGKLKRTQTQNYVAPDELKDNITKGKAALSLTGGPQKTNRVDEFKESILQKKEAMKASGGSINKKGDSASKTPSVPEKPTTLLPEALARRQTLVKSNGPTKITGVGKANSYPPLTGPQNVFNARETLVESQNGTANSNGHSREITKPETSRQSGFITLPKRSETDTPSASVRQEDPPETSKLAARLNPSLATFLTRSGSPKIPGGDESSSELPAKAVTTSVVSSGLLSDGSGSSLTHMTKARAKGPKRRLPKAETIVAQDEIRSPQEMLTTTGSRQTAHPPSNSETMKEIAKPPKELPLRSLPKTDLLPLSVTPRIDSPTLSKNVIAKEKIREPKKSDHSSQRSVEEKQKPKPTVAAKSPELRKVSLPPPSATLAATQPLSKQVSAQNFDIATDHASPVTSNSPSKNMKQQPSIVQSENTNNMPLTPSRTKVNSPRTFRPQNDTPQKSPAPKSAAKPKGLGLSLDDVSSSKTTLAPSEPTPPPENIVGRSKHSWASPTRQTEKSVDIPSALSPRGKGKAVDASRQLEDFFDQMPKAQDRAEFDAQKVLTVTDESSDKIKTLKMQIWEITGDGKRQDMPPQQEHILFEECMYLCTYTFHNTAGAKSSEVYLWCGDGVAEAAVEDAQLFCKKIARENSAKLEVLKQGKETSRFFQALGGIVITRRSKSSALYMLCGRRHLGHVAFDEVDFDPSKLCSGFPYIISAKFGKLFLWKGRGSGADELGCARLIGMDLGLTGEIEEIDEGKEPTAFFDAFSTANGKKRQQSSEFWQLKSSHDAYTCRLYRVEHDRPKSAAGFWGRRSSSPAKSSSKASVEEVTPFCQRDLEASHVYMLDAYFEIYVFVGSEAQSKSAEFVTAASLAQEMSILTPSLQDRPRMPLCHVVFGEPPSDFKATFRKWQMQRGAPSATASTMTLNDAIEALG